MSLQVGDPALCNPYVFFGVLVVHAVAIFVANERSPDNKVADEAFFRKYQLLPDLEKKKLRKILDAWEDE